MRLMPPILCHSSTKTPPTLASPFSPAIAGPASRTPKPLTRPSWPELAPPFPSPSSKVRHDASGRSHAPPTKHWQQAAWDSFLRSGSWDSTGRAPAWSIPTIPTIRPLMPSGRTRSSAPSTPQTPSLPVPWILRGGRLNVAARARKTLPIFPSTYHGPSCGANTNNRHPSHSPA